MLPSPLVTSPFPGVVIQFSFWQNSTLKRMTCRRVITGFSTQTLHSIFRAKSQKFSPQHFAIYFDPPKLLPQKTRGKGHSFTSSGPSLWVSKFQPRFWVGFFWEAQFSDPVWRIQGTKNVHLFSKKEILSLSNVFSVHHPLCKWSVTCFQVCYLYPFWGNLFGTCSCWKCI